MTIYKTPPINELVLDVQFQDVPLTTVDLVELRSLFFDAYPEYEEREPLRPELEAEAGGLNLTFNFTNLPPLRRQWFKNKESTQLFQLQPNRLIHNWRRLEGLPENNQSAYPRFNQVEAEFGKYLNLLNTYVESRHGAPLILNQWELSKFNLIELDDEWARSIYETFSCLGVPYAFDGVKVENAMYQTQNTLTHQGVPFGRLYVSLESVDRPQNRRAALLRITARGRPDDVTIRCSLEKINLSNDIINNVFNGLTTPEAQKKWQ